MPEYVWKLGGHPWTSGLHVHLTSEINSSGRCTFKVREVLCHYQLSFESHIGTPYSVPDVELKFR